MNGNDRHHLYLTAFATGFRSGELAKLTPASFDLLAEPPSVSLPGRDTKNKKCARQILPRDVASALRAFSPADRRTIPSGQATGRSTR